MTISAIDCKGPTTRVVRVGDRGPLLQNPSYVAFWSLMRWCSGDRIGHSEMADIFGMEFLAER